MARLILAVIPNDEYDLREKFEEVVQEGTKIEWFSYPAMVMDLDWQAQDVLVVSDLVMPDRGEVIEVIHRAHQVGGRVLYVGIGTGDTEDWKRVLVMNGVYDFVFFSEHEIDLLPIKELIVHPRSAKEVSAYFPAPLRPSEEEITLVENIVETKKEITTTTTVKHSPKMMESEEPRSRFPRLRWGKRDKQADIQVVQPRVMMVVGLVPRAGVSTIATILAKLFASRLTADLVGIVEHPKQWPRLWEQFQLDAYVPLDHYRHWTQDDVGHHVEVEGIRLVPVPPGKKYDQPSVEQEMVRYIYRQHKGSITIIDGGQNVQDELLLSMVDRVLVVIDCDPTLLSMDELGARYERLTAQYKNKLVTVLNKWTKYAKFPRDLFENTIKLPYLSPDHLQRALWNSRFVEVSELKEELNELTKAVVDPLLPPPIATLLHEHERYRVAATSDALTGCLNRKGMQEWFSKRQAQTNTGFVLLLFDLDYFKRLNDTKGHAAGDEALREVSAAFQRHLRASDVIIRLGGDEFVVILENTTLSPDLAKKLEELKGKLPLQAFELDLTMGVACYPEHGQTLEQLLAFADARLYEGKRAGKGCIVMPD